MRTCAWFLIGLGMGLAPSAERVLAEAPQRTAAGSPTVAAAVSRAASAASARTGGAPSKSLRQPYEGVWGGDGKMACRDEDGVDRMSIEGNRFYWYETRCRARKITAESRRSWTMRVSCEGEGQRYRARLRLSLPTPDRLIMDDAPVGPTKRQLYLRCIGR